MKQSCMWMATGEIQCREAAQGRFAEGQLRSPMVPGSEMFTLQNGSSVTTRTMGNRESFFFGAVSRTPSQKCVGDADCRSDQRCDMGDMSTSVNGVQQYQCVTCSEVGCVAGKSCDNSGDCAVGLSCLNNTCTIGSIQTQVDTGNSYNNQRIAYSQLGSRSTSKDSRDCALTNSCGQGFPCDSDAVPSQCGMGLMCDGGVCRSQQASACHYSTDCGSGLVCLNATCVQPSYPASSSSTGFGMMNYGLDYLARQSSYF